jgi:hypothetical protein
MNFEKAMKELYAGKKIRRKEWGHLTHLRMIDDKVVAFRGEVTHFNENPNLLISRGWKVVDGDGTEMTFLEGIEQLRAKKCLTKDNMENEFIFIDGDNIAMCKPVEFDFMPTWKCINSDDWSVMK